ncbi:MAG: helix-turn-helix transcriptional regulator [Planctomycetota bacterium]
MTEQKTQQITPEIMRGVAARLKEAREKNNLSYRQIKEMMGLDKAMLIKKIETGQAALNLEYVAGFAAALNLDLNVLIMGIPYIERKSNKVHIRFSARELLRREIKVIDADKGIIGCTFCEAQWKIKAAPGDMITEAQWICPKGCNKRFSGLYLW